MCSSAGCPAIGLGRASTSSRYASRTGYDPLAQGPRTYHKTSLRARWLHSVDTMLSPCVSIPCIPRIEVAHGTISPRQSNPIPGRDVRCTIPKNSLPVNSQRLTPNIVRLAAISERAAEQGNSRVRIRRQLCGAIVSWWFCSPSVRLSWGGRRLPIPFQPKCR